MNIIWILAMALFFLLCQHCSIVIGFGLSTTHIQMTRTRQFHLMAPKSRALFMSSLQQDDSNQNLLLAPTADAAVTTNSTAKFIEEAEILRQKAKKIMAEARALEASLIDNKYTQRKIQISALDDMIELLTACNGTSVLFAETIKKERWSPEQALKLMDRLHERQCDARKTRSPSSSSVKTITSSPTFQIGDTRNAAANETEWQRLNVIINGLIDAAYILDNEEVAAATTATAENKSNNNTTTTTNNRWKNERAANSLKYRINELRRTEEQAFQRKLAADINTVVDTNTSVENYLRKTLGLPTLLNEEDADGDEDNPKRKKREFNLTRALEKVAMFPRWVPTSLLPLLVGTRGRLNATEIQLIKDDVLLGSKFYCTSSESVPAAALFRGNVRITTTTTTATTAGSSSSSKSKSINNKNRINASDVRMQTSSAFEEIQERLKSRGLDSRVQLFFLPDPNWRPGQDEREQAPKPVILALPTSVRPDESKPWKQGGPWVTWGKRLSVVLSVITTATYAISCYALNTNFLESVVNKQDWSVLPTTLPVLIGIIAIQAIHEAAHFVVAKARGITIGPPTPLPSMEIGSFGCITPIRSFPPNRSALLDFALSGPVSALAISLVLMIFGIHATVHASSLELAQFPVVPIALLKSSFLTGSLLTVLAPKTMLLPLSQPIPVHPCFIIGFTSMLSSALNLLPIFRLDGGRASDAVLGPRFNGISTALTMLMVLSLALSGSALAFWWGVNLLLFQRRFEIPIRDQVTEVDDIRVGAWLISLAMAVFALVPFPGSPGIL